MYGTDLRFIFIEKSEKEQHKENVVNHLLVHSSKGHKDESWARLKPGSWSSIWAHHMDGRGKGTQAACTASPGH